WRSSPGQILLGLGTFIMVCYTWVFFRSPTLERAQMIIFSMNGGYGRFGEVDLSDYELIGVGVITVAVLTVHWFLRSRDLEDVIRKIPWGIVSGGLALMIYAIVTSLSGDDIA